MWAPSTFYQFIKNVPPRRCYRGNPLSYFCMLPSPPQNCTQTELKCLIEIRILQTPETVAEKCRGEKVTLESTLNFFLPARHSIKQHVRIRATLARSSQAQVCRYCCLVKKQWCIDRAVLMFQLEQRYIVPQHGNTVRLLPSALPPRLTNEARGANRAAHERWKRAISLSHTHTHPIRTSLCRKMGWGGASALLFKQPSDSLWFLPFSLYLCHGSSQQGYFSDKKTGKRTRCTS